MNLTDPLKALRERYQASTGTTVGRFRALAERLGDDPTSVEVLRELRQDLHRVRGTAGTYGYAEASRLAHELEVRALQWIDDAQLEVGQRVSLVEEFAQKLEDSLA